MHSGALVMAQDCTKLLNKKVELRGHSIFHLKARLRFNFMEHLKMHKIMKKMMKDYIVADDSLHIMYMVRLRVHSMLHLRINLVNFIKMHKRVHEKRLH